MKDKNTINSKCRCCRNSNCNYLFDSEVIGKEVSYYECPDCGYVQTEIPHWLKQAYEISINDSDTGIMVRNITNARYTISTLFCLGILKDNVLDYAGGYGLLVRLLRDYGVEALWSDLYSKNLLAQGFEHNSEIKHVGLVTAFEVFEHFVHPDEEIERIFELGENILFSTELVPEPTPNADDWWYYGKEHGQHIGFFRTRTLEKIAQKKGKYFSTYANSYHLFSSKPVNKYKWWLMMRLNRLIVPVVTTALEPKTCSDHEYLSNKS